MVEYIQTVVRESSGFRDRLRMRSDGDVLVRGTTVHAAVVLERIRDGWTVPDLLAAHRTLTGSDIRACVSWDVAGRPELDAVPDESDGADTATEMAEALRWFLIWHKDPGYDSIDRFRWGVLREAVVRARAALAKYEGEWDAEARLKS